MDRKTRTNFLLVIKRPTKVISDGLFGEDHTMTHRIMVGTAFMVVGVNIAACTEFVHIAILKITLDGIGYLIHGIGAVPFVELIKKFGDDK